MLRRRGVWVCWKFGGGVIVADGASSGQEFTHTHTHTRTHTHTHTHTVQANDRQSGGIERCDGLVRECPSLSSAANELPPPPLRGHGTPHKTDTWNIELSIQCLCVTACVWQRVCDSVCASSYEWGSYWYDASVMCLCLCVSMTFYACELSLYVWWSYWHRALGLEPPIDS